MKFIFLYVFYFFIVMNGQAQIRGCTDSLSKNFNAKATENDGSCEYKKSKIKPEKSILLDNQLKETSGLIYFDSMFWSHNDDGDTTIYAVDSTGKVVKFINLNLVKNTDWEEIAQDSNYIYINDFGNNVAGNRKDLHILKINKSSLHSHNQEIDTIAFSYSDQLDFSPLKNNNSDYDGEAFIATRDSLYIFSKQWKSQKTTIYVLPKAKGKHVAQFKSTFKIKGLVTGATFLEDKNILVLCGYSKKLKPFLYLFYDFKGTDFFGGNKRRINLKLPFHQIEGIATPDGLTYYLTNENFQRKPFINVKQQLHRIDLKPYLHDYLKRKKD